MAVTNPGDVQRVQATFKVAGVPTNPGTMTLTVKAPGRASVNYQYPNAILANPSTGVFVALIPVDVDGVWHGAFVGTDPAPGSEPFSFPVEPLGV